MTDRPEQRTKRAEDRRYVAFDYPNVGYVIDGLEDATVRYQFERHLEPGDTVQLRTPEGTVFATAEVEEVLRCELRHAYHDMVVVDDRAHPSSGSDDLREWLNGHYDETVRFDDVVTVIYFDVLDFGGGAVE